MKTGKKAGRQGIMISPVSFLPGDNPDFQGTGIRRAALLCRSVTAITGCNNF